jgi:hypothetical protein
LRTLLADPWFYLFLGGLISLTGLAIRQYVRRAVDHRFDLRLESHRAELQRIGEHERFELQRKLAASSLYLQKQHVAAAEIYSAVRVAHGFVSRLFGLQEGFTLEDCNEDDLRSLLKDMEVLKGKQDELLATWRIDKRRGIEAIEKHLFELRLPRAENKLQLARNLMYVNEIYFSDSTIEAFDKFVGVCLEWIARSKFPPERGERVKMVSRDELNGALERVQIALRAELSDPAHLPSRVSLPAPSNVG